jgi:hypothetical protein
MRGMAGSEADHDESIYSKQQTFPERPAASAAGPFLRSGDGLCAVEGKIARTVQVQAVFIPVAHHG